MPDIFGRKSSSELGWDDLLNRVTPTNAYSPQQNSQGLSSNSALVDAGLSSNVVSGDFSQPFFNAKQSPTDTTTGFWQGLDPTSKTFKWIIGGSTSSVDWNVTTADTLTIVGTINATAGYFGSATNGVQITSNGLQIVGTGYIRTNSTGARCELVKSGSFGLDTAISLTAYDASEFQYFIVSPTTGIYLRSDGTISRSLLRADASDGSIGQSRITSQGYFNFPKYRHRSEFDEASNAWASTNLAKTYWVTTDAVSGTAEIINSAANPHAHLDTTATASRTATIRFVKQFDMSAEAGFETFTQPGFTTNGIWFWGWWKDDTHYIGFIFDTLLSSTNIYFGWGNGGSLIGGGYNVIDTGIDTSTSTPRRYTMYWKGGQTNSTNLHVLIDGVALSDSLIDSITNPFSPGTSYYPFVQITNKAAAQSNVLDIAYIDVFGGRDI